jgi:hypothetical protein
MFPSRRTPVDAPHKRPRGGRRRASRTRRPGISTCTGANDCCLVKTGQAFPSVNTLTGHHVPLHGWESPAKREDFAQHLPWCEAMVVHGLVPGNAQVEEVLADATEGAEIAQTCPDPLYPVGMDIPDAVTIVVASPLSLTGMSVADGVVVVAHLAQGKIGPPLVGVDPDTGQCFLAQEGGAVERVSPLDQLERCGAGRTAEDPDDGRPVVVEVTMAIDLVGATPRKDLPGQGEVRPFPRRSGTSRRRPPGRKPSRGEKRSRQRP